MVMNTVRPEDYVATKRLDGMKYTWVPRDDSIPKETTVAPIPAQGLRLKCDRMGIDPSDAAAIRHHRHDLDAMPVQYPKREFGMSDVVAFDLEHHAHVRGRRGLSSPGG